MFAGLMLLGWSARPQPADDKSWADRNFIAAFDEFFPISHAEGDFIAARAHRDGVNDLPEFSVVIENTDNSRAILGTLREAQGAPLYQQLAALHAKNPAKPYDQLKQGLKVQVWQFSASQCRPSPRSTRRSKTSPSSARATMTPPTNIRSCTSFTNRSAAAIPR